MNYILIFIIVLLYPLLTKEDMTIHMIAHSHMDPGWIKTDKIYYEKDVRKIYKTVYDALMENKERKFVFAEIINFKRWYEEQDEEIKKNVKEMIKNGRIELVGGGYIMHDEATTHYQDMIDQTRLGLKYTLEEFGIITQTQWNIDEFGHSEANAYLMSQLGYKQVVVNRIHYQEFKERMRNGKLQFVFKPFNNRLNKKVLYHIIPFHYGQGQCKYCDKESKPKINEEIEISAKTMINEIRRVSKGYTNPNIIMHLMGDDFTYTNMSRFERNELVMKYINTHLINGEQIKIFYSTPREYFKAIYEDNAYNNKTFPLETNVDFFPYADQRYAYWTGYFTSRPYLKGIIRKISNYLNSFSMLLSEYIIKDKLYNQLLDNVRAVNSHMQHHDAITGTSKERVNDDYIEMCQNSMMNADNGITNYLEHALDTTFIKICLNNGVVDLGCQNVFLSQKNEFVVGIYNPHANGKILVNIEIQESNYIYNIYKDKKEIDIDFYCINQLNTTYINKCFISFFMNVHPSISIYYITINRKDNINNNYLSDYPNINKLLVKDQGMIDKLEYNPNTFEYQLKLKDNSEEYKITMNYIYIIGHRNRDRVKNDISDELDGDDLKAWPKQNKPFHYSGDGSYLFSPDMERLFIGEVLKDKSFIYKGNIGTTLFIYYKNIGYMISTIYYDPLFIKVDHILFKRKKFERGGENIIFKINTNINNSLNFKDGIKREEFYTDSNGMKMLRRIKDYYPRYKNNREEQIANNFYPITNCISIRQRKSNEYNENEFDNFSLKDRTITIFSDKPQAGSSLNEGEILLLIQRNSMTDDMRGVAEALYERHSFSIDFKSSHFIFFGNDFPMEHFMYNYLHNSPILLTHSKITENDIKSRIDELFIIKGENIRRNIEIVNKDLIIVQFHNHYDYYFEGDSGRHVGSVEINRNKLNGITVKTDYNGLKYITSKSKDLLKFLLRNKHKVIIGDNDFVYFYLYLN